MWYARCLSAKQTLRHKALNIPTLLLIILLSACHSEGKKPSEDGNAQKSFPFNAVKVWQETDSTMKAQTGWMYADTYTRSYYQQGQPQLLWATEKGIDERADTLLNYLLQVDSIGLRHSSFHVEEIQEGLAALRAMNPDSCQETEVCQLEGKLEYLLSEAYMRYAYGQRYGYIRPHKLFNNLLEDTPATNPDGTKRYRRIFDIKCDQPNDSLFQVAKKALANAYDLSLFLQSIQPEAPLYQQLCTEYRQAMRQGDEARAKLCSINLERCRWRYTRPTQEKHIWVNLASFTLSAVNDEGEVLSMKVCGGDKAHKTPLLGSKIHTLELNPYWVIPTSIIRNEYIPYHLNDSSYYARNRIVAIENQTKEEVAPWLLSASELESGRYTLRQEKGEGNSLGRMIFRFPNDFAVFLHDTNNPSAFNRSVRAVSHGCIRVERPLDLAVFLMDDPDDYTIDLLRIAIGKKPLSEEGKKLIEDNPEAEGMHNYRYKPQVPVFLDYYTLYPDPETKELKAHPDNYGYDKEIERILNQF